MNITSIIILSCAGIFIIAILLFLFHQKLVIIIKNILGNITIRLEERDRIHNENREKITEMLLKQQTLFDEHQLKGLTKVLETLQNGMTDIRSQITGTLTNNAEALGKRVDKLTQETNSQLKEISGQVEKRLSEGFEKTTATFTDVVKRLALIDEAQKKITELSGNVVSLQEILADKRSRGAFGEVQLSSLINNIIPPEHFALQYKLSNDKRVDCILFLPEPTGNIAIDAKFPLESYQKFANTALKEDERKIFEQQFRIDIKKHIQDIAEKYIIPGETGDGALMFIPAEAIFAEIHAHFPELVESSYKAKVWMVSPTTMMAILNTARAVIKDAATKKQVHLIQTHLIALSKDFERFQKRMDNLAKHVTQAHSDIEEVHQSSQKITSRFIKIESVELDDLS
jgi:DNA recombination protein RmuC